MTRMTYARRTLPLLSALLVALSAVPARAQVITPVRDATSRALLALENQWAAALVKRDGATFERLLAPGFVYTENAEVMTREDVIRSVTSGSDTVTAARNDAMEVHRYYGTTAVVLGWLVVQGRGASGPFEHRYRFTDTWVKSKGKWRIVAAQDFLAPAAAR